MRACRKCWKPKLESEFGVNRFYPDERARICKQCCRDHTRKMRAQAVELLRTTKVRVSYSLLGMK